MPALDLQCVAPPMDLQGIEACFAEDIPYDTHRLTTFDIFLPESNAPTACVVYIHGGGFSSGDKSWIYESEELREDVRAFLRAGVAVATINYRLLESNEKEGVRKCLNDAKRALQFMRYHHRALNLDKEKFVLCGSSAGGGIALWLATNDDLQEVNHSDPVLRESSRVKAAALYATQASYDIEGRWIHEVFADFNFSMTDLTMLLGTSKFFQVYGVGSWEEYQSTETALYRTQVDMLAFLSADDPPLWIYSTGTPNGPPANQSALYHHPFHAREIKKYADAAGVKNICRYGTPLLYSDADFQDYVSFLLASLNE
ncbi:alpha/beta hydrolase [Thermonema rossianum]|uniref:alpha/beta hydrolase n=1 Tax=Thermonema rossianum TaxID=55505 RepID=UPI000689E778|nr:alpha/beta hydrolase [Thermonema rossianum]